MRRFYKNLGRRRKKMGSQEKGVSGSGVPATVAIQLIINYRLRSFTFWGLQFISGSEIFNQTTFNWATRKCISDSWTAHKFPQALLRFSFELIKDTSLSWPEFHLSLNWFPDQLNHLILSHGMRFALVFVTVASLSTAAGAGRWALVEEEEEEEDEELKGDGKTIQVGWWDWNK